MKSKIFISSRQLDKFQSNFQENVIYDTIKSHKKIELHSFSRKHNIWKTAGESNWTPHLSFLSVKKAIHHKREEIKIPPKLRGDQTTTYIFLKI